MIEPRVEALIKATGIDFRIGGNRAFYMPAADYVQVPPPQAYFETINWHRTALHELGHATGHASRLGRDLSGSFGSKKYVFEELVAEMNAAFCCASIGIVPTVRHADYIGSWLEVLHDAPLRRGIQPLRTLGFPMGQYLLAPAGERLRGGAHVLDLGRRKTIAWIATNGWLDSTLSAKRIKRGTP